MRNSAFGRSVYRGKLLRVIVGFRPAAATIPMRGFCASFGSILRQHPSPSTIERRGSMISDNHMYKVAKPDG